MYLHLGTVCSTRKYPPAFQNMLPLNFYLLQAFISDFSNFVSFGYSGSWRHQVGKGCFSRSCSKTQLIPFLGSQGQSDAMGSLCLWPEWNKLLHWRPETSGEAERVRTAADTTPERQGHLEVRSVSSACGTSNPQTSAVHQSMWLLAARLWAQAPHRPLDPFSWEVTSQC